MHGIQFSDGGYLHLGQNPLLLAEREFLSNFGSLKFFAATLDNRNFLSKKINHRITFDFDQLGFERFEIRKFILHGSRQGL
jgi:hypothetical protein